MSELQAVIEAAYESAKAGDWDQLLADWSGSPVIAKRCSRYTKPSSAWTFLHQAAYFGNEEACRLLIRLGSSLEARTIKGQIPADVAEGRGHRDLAELLKAATNGRQTLWTAPADPDVLPSSNLWSEATAERAFEELLVAYGGGLVRIPAGSTHHVDSMGRTLVGWHGTYDPPCGMDGESMLGV